MTEFEAFIDRAVKGGLSFEDIATGFTEALNKAENANKSKEKRRTYLLERRAAVKSTIDRGEYSFEIAAAIAGIAAADRNESWEEEDIDRFIGATTEALEKTCDINDVMRKGGPLDTAMKALFGKDNDDVKLQRFLRGLT